jgi:prevent-host-death family protein
VATPNTVGAFEAKTHLAALLGRVEAGESITITKHGRPVARLVPVDDVRGSRDWGDFWARVDERRESMSAGGVAFTQEQIKDDITQGRL